MRQPLSNPISSDSDLFQVMDANPAQNDYDSRLGVKVSKVRECAMKWLHFYILPSMIALGYIEAKEQITHWDIMFARQPETTIFQWNNQVRSVKAEPSVVGFNLQVKNNLISYRLISDAFLLVANAGSERSPFLCSTMGVKLSEWFTMSLPTPPKINPRVDNPVAISIDNTERDGLVHSLKILCRSSISDLFRDTTNDTRKWCENYVEEELSVKPVPLLKSMIDNLSLWLPDMMSAYKKRKLT